MDFFSPYKWQTQSIVEFALLPTKWHLGLTLPVQQKGISSDCLPVCDLWVRYFQCTLLSVRKWEKYPVPLGNDKPEEKGDLAKLCWRGLLTVCPSHVLHLCLSLELSLNSLKVLSISEFAFLQPRIVQIHLSSKMWGWEGLRETYC